jgi:hypothetical protein
VRSRSSNHLTMLLDGTLPFQSWGRDFSSGCSVMLLVTLSNDRGDDSEI